MSCEMYREPARRSHRKTKTGPSLACLALFMATMAAGLTGWPPAEAKLVPERLHCISTSYYGAPVRNGSSLLARHHIEEYTDLGASRSSLLVQTDDNIQIFYNHLRPGDRLPGRRMLVYRPLEHRCESQLVSSWQLSKLRSLLLNLEASLEFKPHREVSLGPSGLLYAIEIHLDAFKFTGTIFNKAWLNMVNVYQMRFTSKVLASSPPIAMVVHVPYSDRIQPREGDPLANLYREAGGPFESLNIILVGVCILNDERRSTLAEAQLDPAQDPKAHLGLDEDSFCEPKQTRFVIHYDVVEAHRPGTLMGQSLEELGQGHYDFHREPFMQPAGMGCWNQLEQDPSWQPSLTRSRPIEQLSAEYVTQLGSKGLSFVAYDRASGLLRLDRNGRKGIFDLRGDKSYHMGEFNEPHEILKAEPKWTGAAARPDSVLLERCLVQDISSSSQLKAAGQGGVVQQLLGLEAGSGSEHYLGSRTIDHANYEVFEKELGADQRAPLLVEAALPRERNDRRMFLTYYAQSVAELWGWRSGGPAADTTPLLLRYMELWLFDAATGERTLLNRLHFTEFSWQLDVEPANDAGSRREGATTGLSLFELNSCQQDRAGQSELLVALKRDNDIEPNGRLLAELHHHRRLLDELVQRLLVDGLELSQLNLANFQLAILDSGDLLASARIIEPATSLASLRAIGYGYLNSDIFRAHYIGVFYGRHSLEECKLDSAAMPLLNWLAFCPDQAVCLILAPSEELKSYLEGGKQLKQEQEGVNVCRAYAFRYSATNGRHSGRLGPVMQAESKAMLLDGQLFAINFTDDDRHHNEGPSYRATVRLRKLKQLDSIGGRLLGNEGSLLAGLRYSTTDEEPAARNFNSRLGVPSEARMDTFRYCQLACQLDTLCGSFSICRRARGPGKTQQDDCVLASLRLSAERIGQMVEAAGAAGKQAQKFQLQVTGARASQVLMIHLDPSCSLHSRDFLADYELKMTHIKLGVNKLAVADLSRTREQRRLSLDDCAGLSFELNLLANPNHVNFTYCPLESNCVVSGDEGSKHLDELEGYCFVYERNSALPYQHMPAAHLLMARKGGPPAGPAPPTPTAMETETGVAPASPRALAHSEPLDRVSAEGLVQKLWKLTSQECASECNFHRSHCLAYDICGIPGQSFCVLYQIRSPLATRSAYLRPLKKERLSSMEYNVTLVNSVICSHHYLKPEYFEVRLNSLLQLEAGGASFQEVSELETEIANEHKRESDQQLKELEEAELSQARGGRSSRPSGAGEPRPAPHAAEWFHSTSLLFGLLLGTVATLYRQQIRSGLAAGYRWYQVRSERPADGLTTQLVLERTFR